MIILEKLHNTAEDIVIDVQSLPSEELVVHKHFRNVLLSSMYLRTAAKSVQLTWYAEPECSYNTLLMDISSTRSLMLFSIKIVWFTKKNTV